MRLMLAYDGSPGSDAALEDLRHAGLPENGEMLVLTIADIIVFPREDPVAAYPEAARAMLESRDKAQEQALTQANRTATSAADRFREMFPNWTVDIEVTGDSPAWGIIRMADEWQPDLLVMGAQGHSALGGHWLGSISQRVLAETCCSVRIGRHHIEPESVWAPLRIIVGWDGSPDAWAAISKIAGNNWPLGTEIRLLTVLDPHVSILPYPISHVLHLCPGLKPWYREDAPDTRDGWGTLSLQRLSEAAADYLRAAGLAVSPVMLEGNPKRLLLEQAKDWGADSIYLGGRGFSMSFGHSDLLRRLERFCVGSTTVGVTALSPCSVEITRYVVRERPAAQVEFEGDGPANPLPVREIMSPNVVTAPGDATVDDIARLLLVHHIHSVPIVDDGHVLGTVGEDELFLKEERIPFSMNKAPRLFNLWVDLDRLPELYQHTKHTQARDIMSHPALCADVQDDVGKVAQIMLRKKLDRLPVLEDGKLVGIVTRMDLVRCFLPQEEQVISAK